MKNLNPLYELYTWTTADGQTFRVDDPNAYNYLFDKSHKNTLDIDSLKPLINTNKYRINSLTSLVDKNKKAIDSLDYTTAQHGTDMSHMRRQIDDINGSVKSLGGNLDNMDRRIERAESDSRSYAGAAYDKINREKEEREKSINNLNRNLLAGVGSAGGAIAGNKLTKMAFKHDRLKQFKDLVLTSDNPIELKKKIIDSGFNKLYPKSIQLTDKVSNLSNWKSKLLKYINIRTVAAPIVGTAAGGAAGGILGYNAMDLI